MPTSRRLVPCVLLAAIATPAAAATTGKADICHWDANRAQVSSVATSAVASHLAQHGDSYASQYFRDSDGDGFGDPSALTDRCPNVGYVANSDDCNDADASLSPNATEVPGDGIDNDCNPLTLDDRACRESNEIEVESNFSDLGEVACHIGVVDPPIYFAEDSQFSNPSIASGAPLWMEGWYRTVLGAENPDSPNFDAYDWTTSWEWISDAGEHVSTIPVQIGITWEGFASIGIGPGDYAFFCAFPYTPMVPNLPSGNWTLWTTVIDHEKGTTLTSCNAAIFTVP